MPSPKALAASITAFDAEGRFDAEAQRAHFRRLAAAGIGAIVGSSGAGEGYTLSDDEWRELLAAARDELKGKVPFVLMGMEARSAEQMIRQCELARPFEPDVVHVYGLEIGHGWRATPAESEGYLRDVLDAVDMPCSLCNQPQMNGFELPVPLLKQLVGDYSQIVGVQDTSGDLRYLAAVREAVGGGYELLSTIDQGVSLLAIGGHGFSSSEANVAPELSASVIEAFVAGDYERCHQHYRLLMSLNRLIRSVPGSSVPPTKAALRAFGLPGGGGVRRPRLWCAPEDEVRFVEQLTALGVPELVAVRA